MSEELIREIVKRKQLADEAFNNYIEFYKKGELVKASEFLWGVVNNLTYALGLFDGLKLSKHQKIIDYLKMLANSKNDKAMIDEVQAVRILHANFYHGVVSNEQFEYYRRLAESLINKLARILYGRFRETFRKELR